MLFLPAAAAATRAAAARAATPAATPGAALATAPAAAALATTTAASARHDRLQWLIELLHLGRRVEVQDTLVVGNTAAVVVAPAGARLVLRSIRLSLGLGRRGSPEAAVRVVVLLLNTVPACSAGTSGDIATHKPVAAVWAWM
jgi:hypothetical protein